MPAERPAKVSVIGLGLMGGTLAARLLDLGRDVVGYDPDAARSDEHVARGGQAAGSVAGAVRDADVVLLSLPDSAVVARVGAEIEASGRAGLLVIDTTTGDPGRCAEIASRLSGVGIGYVDATVSGNAALAQDREVIFMVGGRADHADAAAAFLEPLGRRVHLVGGVGAGSRVKLVVNHVLAIHWAALAEGLVVAERAGLDLDLVLDVLRDSAAHSKAMDVWGSRMVAGAHWPPASRISLSVKDAGLIVDHAEGLGASVELARQAAAVFSEAVAAGLGNADNSSVIEVMRRRAGSSGDGART